MTFPSSPPPVPPVVNRFARGRTVRAVWTNELGGVTFRLGADGAGDEFVKVATAGEFAGEVARLR